MLEVTVNGKRVQVPEGVTVASALYLAGVGHFRTSVSGEARAPLCGMGICMECRVTIDGRARQRSCQTAVSDGMSVQTS